MKMFRRLSPFARLEDQLNRVLSNQTKILSSQNEILERTKNIMDSLTDLSNEINTVVADVATAQSTILQEIAAYLATQPGGVDFTQQVTALQGVDAAINGLPAQIQNALTPSSTGTGTGDSGSGSSTPAAS